MNVLLLLADHTDIIVLGSAEGTHTQTNTSSHTCAYKHTHTHPVNGILPQHQYFPSPCFL